MDVREKLVELIEKASYECDEGTRDLYDMREVADGIADFLIANGVTVQEWVSVRDKLPEDDSDVLAYSRNGEEGRIYPANYAKGVWFDCIFTTSATDTTTHWMPLPKPPKGE